MWDGGRSVRVVLAVLAAACSHTVAAHHSGSGAKDVAVVTTRTWRHAVSPVVSARGWFTGVDGHPCHADTVEVLPGMHTFIVERDRERPRRSNGPAPCAVTFDARPGHHYRMHYAVIAGTPRATIDDGRAGPLPFPCTVLRPPPRLTGPELK